MALFWLVFCLLVGKACVSGKPPKAIVNGGTAAEGEFPFQAGLMVKNNLMCGASIIDSRHILTAGHCMDKKPIAMLNAIDVITGTNIIFHKNRTVYGIKSFKIHPSYSAFPLWLNDIAVITLNREIKFDEHTKPVKLPTNEDPGDVMAVACGWGDLRYPNGKTPPNLQKLEMRVIPKGKCVLPNNRQVYHSQLCAIYKKGSGLCSGDSGGPLVHNGTIIGLASYVYPCGVGHPDIFTRVYEYVDWIKEVIKKS